MKYVFSITWQFHSVCIVENLVHVSIETRLFLATLFITLKTRAAITKYHWEAYATIKFIFTKFWRLEVRDQGVNRLRFS